MKKPTYVHLGEAERHAKVDADSTPSGRLEHQVAQVAIADAEHVLTRGRHRVARHESIA